jgi:hypothetical protein
MPSRLLGRLKKLEQKLGKNGPKLLVTICQPGETAEEAIRRAEKEIPNFGDRPDDLHIVINTYGDRNVQGVRKSPSSKGDYTDIGG